MSYSLPAEDDDSSDNVTVYESLRGGVAHLSPGVGFMQGFLFEGFLTCFVAMAVLMTSVDMAPFPQQPTSALAVGMATLAATAVA